MVKNEIETILKLGDKLNQRVIGQRHALDMIGRPRYKPPAPVSTTRQTHGVSCCADFRRGQNRNRPSPGWSPLRWAKKTSSPLTGANIKRLILYQRLKDLLPVMSVMVKAEFSLKPFVADPTVSFYGWSRKSAPGTYTKYSSRSLIKGWMEDAEGRYINFKYYHPPDIHARHRFNHELCKDPELMPDPEGIAKALREPLLKIFPAALLGSWWRYLISV